MLFRQTIILPLFNRFNSQIRGIFPGPENDSANIFPTQSPEDEDCHPETETSCTHVYCHYAFSYLK